MSEGKATRYEPIAVSAESTVVAEFIPDAGRCDRLPVRGRAGARVHQAPAVAGVRVPADHDRGAADRQPAHAARGAERRSSSPMTSGSASSARRSPASNEGIVEKTVRIQEDHVQLLKRDDGTTKNITLIDKTNIHNNRLQVINQYEVGQGEGGAARQPLRRDRPRQRSAAGAHRAQAPWRGHPRGVQPDRPLPARQLLGGLGAVRLRAAVRDQQRHADQVLLQHHAPPAPREDTRGRSEAAKTSNSFEFTSWWADATNKPIQDLTASPRRSSPSTRC